MTNAATGVARDSGRTFRLFVSSTFDDFTAEREVLRRDVFPALDDLCRAFGARFQAIDLRWGISAEAGRDQQTLAICLAEVQRCRRITPRPNFLVLLGDRYGWRPLPSSIPAFDFDAIRTAAPDSASEDLLARFYVRDDNAVPAQHLLRAQPASATNDAEWRTGEARLAAVLRQAASRLNISDASRTKYTASATEQEIAAGALSVGDAAEHVLCVRRRIHPPPAGEARPIFVDFDGPVPDEQAAALRCDLERRLAEHLGKRFVTVDARWDGNRLDSDHLGALAADPAERLADLTETVSRSTIAEAVWAGLAPIILERATASALVDNLEREIAAHDAFAIERGRFVIGRDAVLSTLAAYADSPDATHPLIVVGPAGTGKSSVVARASLTARTREDKAIVIARFIGATAGSTTGTTLLAGLCSEIARALGEPQPQAGAMTYDELAQAFVGWIERVGNDRHLILFLDALDQLAPGDAARNLAWVPHVLPSHVKLIASVIDGDLADLLARKLMPEAFVNLDGLAPPDASALVDHWLAADQRQLATDPQRRELRRATTGSGLPLYLRLIFEEVRRWRSFDPVPEGADGRPGLPPDIAGAIADLCWRLSRPENHGPVLVSRALGYLTASRYGLTNDEVVAVLSTDGDVMHDFRGRAPLSPATDSLPDIVWSRLYADLEPYLAERDANGAVTLTFFHRSLGELIAERYLDGRDRARRHRHLAEFFQRQPNYSRPGDSRSLNRRKIAELPFQLASAGDWDQLVALLSDFDFLQAKVIAEGVAGAVEDLDRALGSGRVNPDVAEGLRLVRATLRLSAHILSRDPGQLRVQLHARIDRRELPVVASLLAQSAAASAASPWLRPQSPSFWRPDGAVVSTIAAHAAPLTALALTSNGRVAVSAAKDGTIKIWDLEREAERFVLALGRVEVTSLTLAPGDDTIVAGDSNGMIAVWDLATGTMLRQWQGNGPVRGIAVTIDKQTVLTGTAQHEVLVWDFVTGKMTRTIQLAQAGSAYFALSADGTRLLVGGLYDYVDLVSLTNDTVMRTFTHGRDTWVSAVAMTPDGRIAVSGDWDGRINVWDADTGRPLARLRGHNYNEKITGLAVTPDGRWVVAASHRGRFSIFDVALQEHGEVRPVRSMGTGTHTVSWLALTADHSRAITAGEDSTLRVWNLRAETDTGLTTAPDPFADDDEDTRPPDLWRRPFDRETVLARADAPAPPIVSFNADERAPTFTSGRGPADIIFSMKKDDDDADDSEEEGTERPPRPTLCVKRSGRSDVWLAQRSFEASAAAFDANRLSCISGEGTVTVWDLSSASAIASLPAPANWESTYGKPPSDPIAVMNDTGSRLMAVHSGRLYLWTVDRPGVRLVADGVRSALYRIADGETAAAFCEDGWLRMWRLDTGAVKKRVRVPRDAVTAFAGDYACWLTAEAEFTRYDLIRQSKDKAVALGAGAVRISSNGCWGVASSQDGCEVWDFTSRRSIVKLPVPGVTSCAFWRSPQGGYAVTAARDLMLWTMPDARLVDRVTGDSPFNRCEFTDSRTVSAGVWRGGAHTFIIER